MISKTNVVKSYDGDEIGKSGVASGSQCPWKRLAISETRNL